VLRGGKPVLVEVTGAVRKVEASLADETYRLWMVQAPLMRSLVGVDTPDVYNRILVADPATATGYVDRIKLFTNAADARVLSVGGEDLRQRLDQLEKELKAVRAALDRIGEALKTDKPPKPE
jgi:hypothetical protein